MRCYSLLPYHAARGAATRTTSPLFLLFIFSAARYIARLEKPQRPHLRRVGIKPHHRRAACGVEGASKPPRTHGGGFPTTQRKTRRPAPLCRALHFAAAALRCGMRAWHFACSCALLPRHKNAAHCVTRYSSSLILLFLGAGKNVTGVPRATTRTGCLLPLLHYLLCLLLPVLQPDRTHAGRQPLHLLSCIQHVVWDMGICVSFSLPFLVLSPAFGLPACLTFSTANSLHRA